MIYFNNFICRLLLLPPANKVCEGYVFTPVCQSFCSEGGLPRWDTPPPSREQTPPRTRGRHPPEQTPWEQTPPPPDQRQTHHLDQRQTPPYTGADPPHAVHAGRYGQQSGGTHPTGMHTCYCVVVTVLISQHKLVVDRECQSPIDTNASKPCPIQSVSFIDCDINAKQTKTNCFTFSIWVAETLDSRGEKKINQSSICSWYIHITVTFRRLGISPPSRLNINSDLSAIIFCTGSTLNIGPSGKGKVCVNFISWNDWIFSIWVIFQLLPVPTTQGKTQTFHLREKRNLFSENERHYPDLSSQRKKKFVFRKRKTWLHLTHQTMRNWRSYLVITKMTCLFRFWSFFKKFTSTTENKRRSQIRCEAMSWKSERIGFPQLSFQRWNHHKENFQRK